MKSTIGKVLTAGALALNLLSSNLSAAKIDEALIQELTGIAPNPERQADEYEALYLKGFAELKDLVETKVADRRNWSQTQLREMVTYISAPEREAQRGAFCGAVAKQLEIPDYSTVGRRILILALGDIGGVESVPALAKLLTSADPNEVELGRMSLQNIPDPESEQALIDALKAATGNTRLTLGLIDSLAARKSDSAVSLFTPLLDNPATEIVSAAATGLGQLGGSEATRALGKARSGTIDQKLHEQFERALLVIANQRGIAGDRAGAGKIFQVLHQQTKSPAIRTAAMIGLARATPAAADAVVIDALRSKDPRTVAAGISASILVPSSRLSSGLASMLDTTPKQVQMQILSALAQKGDLSVQAKVVEHLKKAEAEDNKTRSKRNPNELEVACIKALGPLGSVSVAELLLSKAVTRESDIRNAAETALSQIDDNAMAQTIEFHAREGKTPQIRAVAIGLFMRNRDRTGLTRIMDFAAESQPTVSAAAFDVLRQQASDTEFRKLLDMYAANKGNVVPVLTAVCGRSKNPNLVTSEIITFIRGSDNERHHRFLIGLLPTLGSSNGLSLLKEHIGEGKKANDAALAALSRWPDPTALPEMMRVLSEHNSDSAIVGLMAKGVARLIAGSPEMPLKDRVRYTADAFELSKNIRERRLLLPVLGELPHERSVELVDSMLTDRYLYGTAANAAASLCEKLVATDAEAARALATKLIKGKFNARVKRRAETVLAAVSDGKPLPKDPDTPIFE